MTNWIIYHEKDLDGKCSAAIVYHFLRSDLPLNDKSQDPIEFIPTDYGWPDPTPEGLEPEDHVYMVDFSLPLENMRELNEACHLTWIDHHTKRLQEAEKAGFLANSGQSLAHDQPAACILTWEFFLGDYVIPRGVWAIGIYDAWQLSDVWEDKILPFQLGMEVRPTDPSAPIWDALFREDPYGPVDTEKIIALGRTIGSYRSSQRQFLTKYLAPFMMSVNGTEYICLTLNSGDMRADFWDEMLTDELRGHFDLLLNYWFNGEIWRVDLSPADRENGPDCSEIAHAFGGGGHKGRAGFTCEYPPCLWTLQEMNAPVT